MTEVPQYVIEALAFVRETGLVNMFDRIGAIEVLSAAGMDEAAEWLQVNRRSYGDALEAFGEYLRTIEDE